MTHYVVVNDWIIPGGESGNTIIGIFNFYENALNCFKGQLKEEKDFAKENNLTIYSDRDGYFDAGRVDEYSIHHTRLEIQTVYTEEENNTMNEILERLRNGETEEAIAAEFTAKLNEAAATLRAEDTKGEDTEALLNHINEYFAKYYPNVPTDLCVKDFIETLDALVGTCESLLKADPKDLNLSDLWKLFA